MCEFLFDNSERDTFIDNMIPDKKHLNTLKKNAFSME